MFKKPGPLALHCI